MRLGSRMTALASIVLLGPVCAQEQSPPSISPIGAKTVVEGDGPTDDQKVVAKKVVVPAINADELRSTLPLSDLVRTIDSSPIEVSADMDVDELVRYLGDLSKLSDELADDYRTIQAKLSQQQASVAEAILASSEKVSDEVFYQAAKLGLATWISRIPSATPEEQEATHQLVARQLEVGVKQGVKIDEVRNATRTAELLERHGDRGLAREACSKYAALLRASGADRYRETADRLDDVCRRLDLVGKTFELGGTQLDGSLLQWSDYRNQIVLVHYWASWSLASMGELSRLKRLYETYHPLGFEIVGVCLGGDRSEVEAMVAKEQIPWANLYQPDSGRDHPMALKYGVRRVPSGILVDRNGKVVSTEAWGRELEQWIYRLMGPESYVARDLVAESRWSDAVAELKKLVEKYPDNVDYRVALGAVQLLGDDPSGYAGTCQASWAEMTQDGKSPPPRLLPLFCLPAEHSLDRDQVFEVASKLRLAEDSNATRLALILSAYRSGRDEVCVNEEIIEGDNFSIAVSQLVRSMAAHRLGRSKAAAEWLNMGRRIIIIRFNDYLSAAPENVSYEHWICCAVAKLLLSESQRVLVDNPSPASQP